MTFLCSVYYSFMIMSQIKDKPLVIYYGLIACNLNFWGSPIPLCEIHLPKILYGPFYVLSKIITECSHVHAKIEEIYFTAFTVSFR